MKISKITEKIHAEFTRKFFAGIDSTNPDKCWNWTKGKAGRGYGVLSVNCHQCLTHRAAFLLFRGNEIPAGLYVLHKCDNRLCCNPDHLFLGTHTDNMADMVQKGRQSLLQRDRHGRSIYSSEQVLKFREEFKTWKGTTTAFAKKYKVNLNTMNSMLKLYK